jgi:hypothetical protein
MYSIRVYALFLFIKYIILRTAILLVVVYGFETWSLILREEPRLKVFENRVLRKISEPREELTGH